MQKKKGRYIWGNLTFYTVPVHVPVHVHTHHVDDLEQCEAKFHHDGGGVILDRPFKPVVIFHQVAVEFPLVLSAKATWERTERGRGRRKRKIITKEKQHKPLCELQEIEKLQKK